MGQTVECLMSSIPARFAQSVSPCGQRREVGPPWARAPAMLGAAGGKQAPTDSRLGGISALHPEALLGWPRDVL